VDQDSDAFDVQILEDGTANPIAWITNWNWIDSVSGDVKLPDGTTITVDLPPGGSTLHRITPQ